MSVIKWLGAIVAVIIIVVVALGALAYFRVIPIPTPILTLLVGAKPPEHSARYYPPDTLAYTWVTLLPREGQYEEMQDIWDRSNEFSAFRDLVDEAREEFVDETGIDFDTEVMPWIGPELSAGLIDLNLEREEVSAAAMFGVRDHDAAANFLAKWQTYMADETDADFRAGSYLGYDIAVDEERYQAYALTDDWLVYATGEAEMKLILDRIDGIDEPSLAANPNFIAAREALPDLRFSSLYFDYRQVIQQLGDLPTGGFAPVNPMGMAGMAFTEQAPDWAAGSAGWVERGITIEMVAPATDFGLEITDLDNPANLLPNDALGFMAATFDPHLDHWRVALGEFNLVDVLPYSGLIDEINLGAGQFMPGNSTPLGNDSTLADALDLGLQVVDDLTGIDLEGEFFDHLAGELILAVRDFDFEAVEQDFDANPIEAVMMLSYQEDGKDGLADTMNKVAGLLRNFVALNATPVDVGAQDGAQVFDLSAIDLVATGYAPGYVLHDGYLTFGSGEPALKGIVARQKGEGDALSSDAEYQRAIGHLPSKRQFLTYIAVNRIIRQLNSDDLDLDIDQYRMLAEGIGVAAANSSTDGELSRGVAVLTLFPE